MTDGIQKCYRALLFDEEEEYVAFIEKMTEHIDGGENLLVAFNNRAVALKEIGRLDEAERDFVAARALIGGAEVVPLLNLAELLDRSGRIVTAYVVIKEALALSPKEPQALALKASIEEKI